MFSKLSTKFLILMAIILVIFIITIYFVTQTTVSAEDSENEDYIKWIDFSVSASLLEKLANLDIKSHNENYPVPYDWIELLAYLSAKYYGNLSSFKQADLEKLLANLNNGASVAELAKDMKYYNYYYESYRAVLGGFIGNYSIQNSDSTYENRYGLKVFSPVARGYSFSHYDDFGASRSYGYKRSHLGNDLMGNIGTPIVAVESGYVEALGWNQYGGWRIGIRSFDGKRYYYYAHLRKDHPFHSSLYEGAIVTAGDVIGYLGMTGYSTTENVNNINVAHLHFGLQIIFDESQKDGINQIWIDVYPIINFLQRNTSKVQYNSEDKEYYRQYNMMEDGIPE